MRIARIDKRHFHLWIEMQIDETIVLNEKFRDDAKVVKIKPKSFILDQMMPQATFKNLTF